jgi:DNA-binding transcriptional regulator YiaG
MERSQWIMEIRKSTGLNRKDFANYLGIPLRTVEDWEAGRRTPPEYIPRLIKYRLKYEILMAGKERNNNE